MTSLQIGKTKDGRHYMTEGEHKVFFLCNQMKQCVNCKVGPCTHTLYLEDSKNWSPEDPYQAALNLDKGLGFEKLYFTDDDYDWWEKED